jgi:signal transduction histidine kinase
VLTFNGRALGKDYLVVQDNNAGVFIVAPESPWAPASRLVVGDSVEIGGNLLPGRFAARLRPRVVNLVGQHTLPAPVLPGAESGPARYRDGQWTELEGVVRTVQPNGSLRLKRNDESIAVWLAKPITFSSSPRPDGAADDRSSGPSPSEEKAGGRRLPAAERDLLETLIDSAVRVRGVISLDTPESPLLLVPSSSFLQILEPARSNLEVRPISTLKLAAAKSDALHRVRVAGVVTYRDEKLLFVQDDSGGIRVQLDENAPVSVGDDLEVRGFPEPFVNSVPVLTDARATRLASTTTITPRPLDLNAPLRDLPNLALVRMKAHLVAQKNFENGQALEIQAGQRVFEALLSGGQQLPPLAPGSLLELTGVCALEIVPSTSSPHPGWDNSSIGAIRLLLRSPADVTLLKGAPWWSWKKAAFIIVVLVLLLAGTVLRGQILRRRFEKQQAARLAFARQLLENQESERRRIAANLHDTLGQNLLAIKNQAHLALQSTVDDEAVHRRLEDISSTVLNALEEVRQITHDLRPYQLDRLGLSQAIRALVRKSSDGGSIELASHVDNIDGVFPKETEMHIYRIVQEGINNVIKHSNATEAAVVLKAENSSLTISIRDNGRGLSQNGAGQEDFAPGFGLSGIRERAQIMNGRVEVEATAGNGFNLKVEIPIPSATGSTSKEHAIKAEVAHRG